MKLICYQCDDEVMWLAPDSRCAHCTRYTPEEVNGTYAPLDEEDDDDVDN